MKDSRKKELIELLISISSMVFIILFCLMVVMAFNTHVEWYINILGVLIISALVFLCDLPKY